MSQLLHLHNLHFAHTGQVDYLIQGASWELASGQKVGLLGYNGAGKSTLLHLIKGELEPDFGVLERHFQSLFVLQQEDTAEGHTNALEYLLTANPELLALHRQMQAMEPAGLPNPLAYADLSQH